MPEPAPLIAAALAYAAAWDAEEAAEKAFIDSTSEAGESARQAWLTAMSREDICEHDLLAVARIFAAQEATDV